MRTRSRLVNTIGTVLLAALAAPAPALAQDPGKPPPPAPSQEGKKPPALGIEEWIGPEAKALDDYVGKNVVILEFFVTWSAGYDADVVPALKAVHAEFKDDGLVVITVTGPDAKQDKREIFQQWVEKHSIPYHVGLDTDNATVRQYGISAIPTTYLIGVDGTVVRQGNGVLQPGFREKLEEALIAVPILPERELVGPLAGLDGFIKTRNWDQVVKRLQKMVKDGGLSEEHQKAAEALLNDVDEIAGGRIWQKIEKHEAAQRYDKAAEMLEDLEKNWRGMKMEEKAEARLKEYKRDKEIKKLRKVGELMAKGELAERLRNWKGAAGAYAKAAKTGKGTDLGAQAEKKALEMVEKLKGEGGG